MAIVDLHSSQHIRADLSTFGQLGIPLRARETDIQDDPRRSFAIFLVHHHAAERKDDEMELLFTDPHFVHPHLGSLSDKITPSR